MKNDLKFTQKIKDKWLEALKSGKYVQGTGQLYNKKNNTYCCYGVLASIIGDSLEGPISGKAHIMIINDCGYIIANTLWKTNDSLTDNENPDYSNVIPLIESLPVQS